MGKNAKAPRVKKERVQKVKGPKHTDYRPKPMTAVRARAIVIGAGIRIDEERKVQIIQPNSGLLSDKVIAASHYLDKFEGFTTVFPTTNEVGTPLATAG